MNTSPPLPDLLRYTCSHCGHTWDDVVAERYGACNDDCPACGARHMSPEVVAIYAPNPALPLLLQACRTLKAAWDAGEESNDAEWEDLTVAVALAEEALALMQPA